MRFISNFFKGVAISISQIVPGVSGGTIAIILGIYDDLIHAINNILKDFKNQYKILLQVGLGAIVGIFLFSNIITTIIDKYNIEMGYLFTGIILGGVPIIYKKAVEDNKGKSNILYLILGIIIVLIMSGNYEDKSSIINQITVINFIWLFVGGIVVAIALILPGISGSFVLLILGLYNTTMEAVAKMNFSIILPIGLGVVVGTLLTARGIEKLLKKYPSQTYMLILGFILGSVVEIFPGFTEIGREIISIVLLISGFFTIHKISKNI
ncbi:DUF368 domain-containing protein [Clostridium ihumii]|uniref:DUF368 domain-containing protein n=1 Tax=Clostridium ihumii TaxID=1470356 RepID=UPI00058F21D5|nr:DUF368 domain-containing protein [Clostridium ihumii]